MLKPADRDAIDGLFRRLAEAETRSPARDPDAEDLIRQRLAQQPNAPYYLAQTVIVQQEALKEAERRIERLEQRTGERLDAPSRGPWDRGRSDDRRYGGGYGAGGFLAGAASTALGVAGGVMLGSLLGSLFTSGAANAAEGSTADNNDHGSSDTTNDNNDNSDANADSGDGGFDAGDGGFDGGDF